MKYGLFTAIVVGLLIAIVKGVPQAIGSFLKDVVWTAVREWADRHPHQAMLITVFLSFCVNAVLTVVIVSKTPEGFLDWFVSTLSDRDKVVTDLADKMKVMESFYPPRERVATKEDVERVAAQCVKLVDLWNPKSGAISRDEAVKVLDDGLELIRREIRGGVTTAYVRTPSLHVTDQSTDFKAFLGLSSEGRPQLLFYGKNKKERVALRLCPDGECVLDLKDDSERDRARIRVRGNGEAGVHLHDHSQYDRLALLLSSEGQASIEFQQRNGRVVKRIAP